jgi:flagellar biosynthesis protein FliR
MNMDEIWLITTLGLFVRCSAILIAAPLLSTSTPAQVRVMLAAVLALALGPAVQPHFGPIPQESSGLLMILFREVMTGLLIGACMNLAVMAAEAAGAFADLQLGLSSAQVFNPTSGGVATPLSRFKHMLAVTLLFASDGHHLIIQALVGSYRSPDLSLASLPHLAPHVVHLVGHSLLLAIQIAAPVAAIGLIIDLAAGLINKAVPQTMPFLLALPAKLALGFIALALGLPAVVAGMRIGVEVAFGSLGKMLGG